MTNTTFFPPTEGLVIKSSNSIGEIGLIKTFEEIEREIPFISNALYSPDEAVQFHVIETVNGPIAVNLAKVRPYPQMGTNNPNGKGRLIRIKSNGNGVFSEFCIDNTPVSPERERESTDPMPTAALIGQNYAYQLDGSGSNYKANNPILSDDRCR